MTFPRCAGVLMHVASLPGDYGIGVLGQEALDFAAFLKAGEQRLWQILPIGPTGFGDSPYQSYSSFAGNPNLIDPRGLHRAGWLTDEELATAVYHGDPAVTDYTWVEQNRRTLYEMAFPRFRAALPADYAAFCHAQAEWLEDYALFVAVKEAHDGAPYTAWEEDIRTRQPAAMDHWRQRCADGVDFHKMLQYFFYTQWAAVKQAVNDLGIQIVGDIPIYVSPDSADVWANPALFRLDKNGFPREVAGCPPDIFSADGQLWGNPVYDWNALRKSGYRFWIKRLAACLSLYDVVRIDHFRAFADYYCIPAGAENARVGVWRKGPGMAFFRAVRKALGDIPVIAEDLGDLSEAVYELLADSGLPGMKVLQFAFPPCDDSEHLPHHHVKNGVVYTGTHDNNTILGWEQAASDGERFFAHCYMRVPAEESLRLPMMLTALASVADVCVLTMQDLIGLGAEARMNTPSTVGGNWRWRATKEQLRQDTAKWLADNTRLYRRVPQE